MKNYVIPIGILAVVIIVGMFAMRASVVTAPNIATPDTTLPDIATEACTEETRACPDGSLVSRTGPNCEFTPCSIGGSVTLEVRLEEVASGRDVSIMPLEVLEDSRCPSDVVCVQAGTVRIRARLVSGLGTATQEFKLGEPITTEAETVTLAEVLPAPRAGVSIAESEYTFRFDVAKR